MPYQVWRFEVDSAIQRLYLSEVVSEQIQWSLYGEAKTKLGGLGPQASCKSLLLKLDQLYSDVWAATGDELLTEAYKFKQGENEVTAFASRLDNQVWQTSRHRVDGWWGCHWETTEDVVLGEHQGLYQGQKLTPEGLFQILFSANNSSTVWWKGGMLGPIPQVCHTFKPTQDATQSHRRFALWPVRLGKPWKSM